MDGDLFHPIFLLIVSSLCLFYVYRFSISNGHSLQVHDSSNLLLPFLLCLILAIWLGHRPIGSSFFGDTGSYAKAYLRVKVNMSGVYVGWDVEWLWQVIMIFCRIFNFDPSTYLTVIEIGYFMTSLWAIKRFVPYNPMVGMLFVLSSLMFFSFGVNGIRNGLACHMMLLCISFYLADRYIPATIIAIMAIGIHTSVWLPLIAVIFCRYAFKNYRLAVVVWILAFISSALFGSFFQTLAQIFPMGEHMSIYLLGNFQEYSNSGFRIDFILYSLPPIVLGWYIIFKKKVSDEWYRILICTYCLCNAFWLLLIRVPYTNRFAYLSWFMYPVVIAYPMLNLPIWKDQDRRISIALLCYWGFTVFMEVFVWNELSAAKHYLE